MTASRDITDHKRTLLLRNGEDLFRHLADTAPVLIWMSDAEKGCVYFNKRWLDFTGRRMEEELVDGWAEGVHPDDVTWCLETYNTAFDRREEFNMEYRLRRHDGEYRWIVDNGVPRFASDGAFLGYVGSCIDITERKEAEQALAERLEFETLLCEVSTGCINLPYNGVDKESGHWLQRIAGFLGIERCVLFQLSEEGDHFVRTHVCSPAGQEPLSPDEENAGFPWAVRIISRSDATALLHSGEPSLSTLQETVLPWMGHGESVRFLPLMASGSLIGLLGFSTAATRDGLDDVMQRLQLFSEILASAFVRKRMDKALRASEALNRTVLNSLQDHVAVLREDGRIVAVNAAWHRFACANGGSGRANLDIGTNYLEICRRAVGQADRYAQQALDGIQAVLDRDRAQFTLEYPCPAPDQERWFMMSVVPLQWPSGGAVVSHTDITERKVAQEGLRKSEQQLRIMADSLPVLISYVDAEQRYRFNNAAYERFFGVSREAITGHPLKEVVGESAYATIRSYVEQALAGQKAGFQMEVPYRGSGNRHVEVSYVPHLDPDGKVLGFFTLVQDVTQRVQAEEQARRQREELAHVARVVTMGELAASIAHELNQPLAAILSNAQAALHLLAADTPDLAEVRAALADIVDDDKRAGEVIRRLRAMLKKGELELAHLDVNDLVREVAGLVRNDAIERKVAFRFDLQERLPPVRGNRVQLQQVLLNLILNAFDAMSDEPPERRVLTVQAAQKERGTVTLSVRDTGPGLDEETMRHMFDPFFTKKPHGLGMGLSISRSILQAHGGRLWATRNSDRGATFHFTLPIDRGGSA